MSAGEGRLLGREGERSLPGAGPGRWEKTKKTARGTSTWPPRKTKVNTAGDKTWRSCSNHPHHRKQIPGKNGGWLPRESSRGATRWRVRSQGKSHHSFDIDAPSNVTACPWRAQRHAGGEDYSFDQRHRAMWPTSP